MSPDGQRGELGRLSRWTPARRRRRGRLEPITPAFEWLERRALLASVVVDVEPGQSGVALPGYAHGSLSATPPVLTPEQRDALEEQVGAAQEDDAEESDPGPAHPPGQSPAPAVGETLASASASASPSASVSATASASPADGPLASGDFVFFHDTVLGDGTSGQTSSTGEPSVGTNGRAVFETGNWYGAVSGDNGADFRYIDPFTDFPTTGNFSGGFCCDQRVAEVPSRDMVLWYLQYVKTGDTSSDTNAVRLAAARGTADLLNDSWVYFDFTPTDFGFGAGKWMDFPHMEVSSNYVYCTSNVFDVVGGTGATNSVMWRIPLDEIQAGGTIHYNYWTRTDGFSLALTSNATTTMYAAASPNTNSILVYSQNEADTSLTTTSITGIRDTYFGTSSAPSPDGTNWLGRSDSRVQTAWVSGSTIGFMWDSNSGTNRPQPFVRGLRINTGTMAIVDQPDLWGSTTVWAYPALAVNARGDLAGPVWHSDSTSYPSTNIVIWDDLSSVPTASGWTNVFGDSGTNGPGSNRWGDYGAAARHDTFTNTWIAGSFVLQGPVPSSSAFNTNVEVHYYWFGRERDTPNVLAPVSDVGDTLFDARNTGIGPLSGTGSYDNAIWNAEYGNRDVDVYSFQAALGGTFSATTSQPTGGDAMDTTLSLFNAAGTRVAFDDDSGPANYSSLSYTFPTSGTYYIVVAGFGNSNFDIRLGGSGTIGKFGDYHLDLSLSPPTDIGDTTTAALATGLAAAPGSYVHDSYLGDGANLAQDVDLYRFDATAGNAVTIATALPNGGVAEDTVVRLFDSAGTPLASDDDSGGSGYSLLHYLLAATGTYYVGVSARTNIAYNPVTGAGTSAGAAGDYRLSLSLAIPNAQPTLNAITSPAAILEDAATQHVTLGGIGAGASESQTLTVSVTSNNPALIGNLGVSYTSPATTGTVAYKPVANASGTAIITVTVQDDGGTANFGHDTISRSFTVQVKPVNDPGGFVKGPDTTVLQDSGPRSLPGWATGIVAGPPDESGQAVNFLVTNTNTALFSAQPAIGPTGTLTFTPAPGAVGTATVTAQLHDTGGTLDGGSDTSAAQTFTIAIVNPLIIDDRKAGYSETGTWSAPGTAGGYGGSYRYAAAGTGSTTATWQFPAMSAGTFDVLATWFPFSNRASNAPYRIYDGATLVATVRVDQRLAPVGLASGGAAFQDLGTFAIGAGPLRVVLGNDADGYVVADGVAVSRSSVIDNGLAGYSEGGTWSTAATASAYGGAYRFAVGTTAAATATATWQTATLPAGSFDVQAAWIPSTNRASNAPYRIYQGATLLKTVRVDQRVAPVGPAYAGVLFQDLGVVTTAAAGALKVVLGNDADGYVIADAVRVVPAATVDLAWQGAGITSPATADTRTPITITRTYTVGSSPAPAGFSIAYYASTDAILGNADDVLLGTEALAAAADRAVGTHSGTSPALTFPRWGTVYLFAKLDAGGQVAETDETNNVIRSATVVTVGGPIIVDNGQPAYSEVGTWTAPGAPGGFGGSYRYAAAGTGSATATWQFANLPAGTYDVQATWFAYPNRASNAPYRIYDGTTLLATVRVDQRQPSIGGMAGASFQDLGWVTTQGRGPLKVVLGNDADGYVIADAVAVARPPLVDDSQAGYSESGTWSPSGVAGGFGGTNRFAAAGASASLATWQFVDLPPGTYDIEATWFAYANRASNAPYRIYDGNTLVKTVRIDQRTAPAGVTRGGVAFQSLGQVTIGAGPLRVVLGNDADGYVDADAVTATRPVIIDDGQPGFAQVGTWQLPGVAGGFGGSYRYAALGTGSITATWQVQTLPPGSYEVEATWNPATNRASNAPYRIYDGNTLLATVRVDQRQAPVGTTAGGVAFQGLGVFRVTTGILKVVLGNDADGYVIADAIRMVPAVPVDLSWTSGGITSPKSADAAASFTVARSYTVGIAAMPTDFAIAYYASTDAVPGNADDVLLGTETISAAAGKTVGVHAGTSPMLTHPAGGPFWLFARLDPGGLVPELVETNNVAQAAAVTGPVVVDKGSTGYTEVGTWSSSVAGGGGFGGSYRYAAKGTGALTATWQVPVLPSGPYVVQATWVASTNRAHNATYRIYDGATLRATVVVDQTKAPTGTASGGAIFQTLGVVTLASTGPLRVVLSDNADGYVVADAIRVVSQDPAGTAPIIVAPEALAARAAASPGTATSETPIAGPGGTSATVEVPGTLASVAPVPTDLAVLPSTSTRVSLARTWSAGSSLATIVGRPYPIASGVRRGVLASGIPGRRVLSAEG